MKGGPDNDGLYIKQRRNKKLHCAVINKLPHPSISKIPFASQIEWQSFEICRMQSPNGVNPASQTNLAIAILLGDEELVPLNLKLKGQTNRSFKA